MARQIINIGTGPNSGTGDNLRSAFDKTNDNFAEIYTAGPVSSNIQISGQTVSSTNTNGNIVLSPNGTGSIVISNDFLPDANNTRTIGSTSSRIKGLYVGDTGLDVSGDANIGGGVNSSGPVKVPRYADSTARDAAITSPSIGMIVVTNNVFQGYNGSTWVNLS
jgi:hypothetical protein